MQIEELEGRLFLSHAGDANSDGRVDSKDFNAVALHFGQSTPTLKFEDGDFNGDHRVNALDFSALAAHFGEHWMSATVVQTKGSTFTSDSSAHSVTLDAATTAGNAIVVFAIFFGQNTGDDSDLTVTDNAGNAYDYGTQSDASDGRRIAIIPAFDAASATTITVTPLANLPAKMSIAVVELSAPDGYVVRGDAGSLRNQSSATPSTTPTALNFSDDLILGVLTHTNTSATTITPGSGFIELYESETVSTLVPISVISKSGVSTSMTSSWTLSVSRATKTVNVGFAVQARSARTDAGPAPAYSIDARDCLSIVGGSNVTLPQHGTVGSTAKTTSTAILLHAGGFNASEGLGVGTAVGSGVFIPYTGALAAIAVCAQITRGAAGSIIGANDAGDGAHGAWTLSNDSSNNLVGQIVTNSSSASATSTVGEAMGDVPVVYWIINDGTHLIVESNGFEVTRLTISGTPLTVNASSALRILNAWASGGDATPSAGTFYSARVFSTVPTAAQRRVVDSDMAWPMGAPLTKRFRIATHNASSALAVAESDNATSWSNSRLGSFQSQLSSGARDFNYAGYDAGTDAHYWLYTANNFANFGGTFGVCKSRGDWRLFVPHCLITATVAGQIDGVTSSPWSPMTIPTLSTPTNISWQKSGTTTVFIAAVSNWPSSPTLGAATAISSNVGDQPTILLPGAVGNPTGLYRAFMGVGYIQTSSTLTGTYGSTVQLSGGAAGEGGWVLARDADVLFINPSDSGWVYWSSTDNGTTWGSVQTMTGLDSPQAFGQGTILDGLAVGVWTMPHAKLSLSLGLSL